MAVSKNERTMTSLVATDALGRKVYPVAGIDDKKQVGLFYFLWIGQHRSAAFDNSKLPLDVQMNDRTGEDTHHYWNEPLFGYYNSEDEWVFRKHLEMFILAGVDYLVFDTTNGYFYPEVCHKIFPVALAMIEDGWKVPGFIFDTNWNSSETVKGIYREYYDPKTENGKKYAPLWYRNKDKNDRNSDERPWIIAKNNNAGKLASQNYSTLPDEIKSFFYLRESAWFHEHETPYAFPTDVDNPEVIDGMLSVSVAQHTSGAFSDSVFEDYNLNRGRGWAETDGKNSAERSVCGVNYQREWNKALNEKDLVDSVFLSTWNEWVAQKQPFGANGRKCCYFVDQYNDEFSRDIEPVNGALSDNFYMQTVENIRSFKGIGGEFPACEPKKTDENDFGTFAGTAEYYGFSGAGMPRNCKSANFALPDYKDDSCRNNIIKINVAHDSSSIRFLITCEKEAETGKDGKSVSLLIGDAKEGKFSFLVETFPESGECSVNEFSREGKGKEIGKGKCAGKGNGVCVAIPLRAIGSDPAMTSIFFKAFDNIDNIAEISAFYSKGTSCPLGRFGFLYNMKSEVKK